MGITKFVFGFDKSDVIKNKEAITSNAAVDAAQAADITRLTTENAAQVVDITRLTTENVAQAVDITRLTTENAAQTVDITRLTTENAAQTEEIAKLAEAVGGQEQAILACAIVGAVAAIAVTSFVAFCIYQGVKLDREKKNDSSKDTPTNEKFSVDNAKKLNNNLEKC